MKLKKIYTTIPCRRKLTLYFFALLLCIPYSIQSQSDDTPLKKGLTNGIALGIPGISIAIGKSDSIVWTGTAGYSDLIARSPIKKFTKIFFSPRC
ncbi:hypothetical protein [Aquimarina algiphila]|uniref:hypothetical protein n=1 Tax=Aquimarina algiphila TaxID=2047982 RepID=UPI00232D89F8|nr:hypothetical protein [Aquimarina algiphila]